MCSGSGAVTSIDAAARMGQDQPAGEQVQLRLDPRRHGAQRIVAGRIVLGLAVVFRVADDRMADRLAMGAQLMGAAGDRPHREPGEARRDLVDHRVEGQRMLGVGIAVLGDPHPLDIRAPGPFAPRSSPMPSPLARNIEIRPCAGFGTPSTSAQ